MIYYKELYDDNIKSGKINTGDRIIMTIDDKDIEFIVLNDVQKDHKIDLMSSVPLIEVTTWKDNYVHNKDFRNVNFLHFRNSILNKKLQSFHLLLPEIIRDKIILPRIRELVNIDLFNSEVSFDYVFSGKLWIPSVSQVYGNSGFSNDDVLEKQFEYFKKPENRILYDNNIASDWWLRSVNILDNNVYYVTETGSVASCDPDFWKVAPVCFTLPIK